MKKIIPLLTLAALLTFCKNSPQVPDNILPKEKMVRIVKDLHLSEAYVNANYVYSDSAKYVFNYLEDSVLKVRGTNKKDFDSSMAYYGRHLKDLDEIYSAVIDSLSLMEGISK